MKERERSVKEECEKNGKNELYPAMMRMDHGAQQRGSELRTEEGGW